MMFKKKPNFIPSLAARPASSATPGPAAPAPPGTPAPSAASGASRPAPVVPEKSPVATSEDFLDPQALAKLGHLELIAQRVVDGFISGKHRSTHKGGCFEFAEYRAYA